MKSIGFEVFKCLHNCSPSYITDMFRFSATPYDTRGGTELIQPKVNTARNGLKSFRYQGAKIWSELPTCKKNTEHVSELKYRLNEWPGPVCKCGSCDVCKFKNIWTVFCHNLRILHACMIEDTYMWIISCTCMRVESYTCTSVWAMTLHIHFQTSSVQQLKFWNG